jgi:hypothetical protein
MNKPRFYMQDLNNYTNEFLQEIILWYDEELKKMTTQKEKAKWFDELYSKYRQHHADNSEIGECPMDEVEFNDRLNNVLKENLDLEYFD